MDWVWLLVLVAIGMCDILFNTSCNLSRMVLHRVFYGLGKNWARKGQLAPIWGILQPA